MKRWKNSRRIPRYIPFWNSWWNRQVILASNSWTNSRRKSGFNLLRNLRSYEKFAEEFEEKLLVEYLEKIPVEKQFEWISWEIAAENPEEILGEFSVVFLDVPLAISGGMPREILDEAPEGIPERIYWGIPEQIFEELPEGSFGKKILREIEGGVCKSICGKKICHFFPLNENPLIKRCFSLGTVTEKPLTITAKNP